MLKGLKGILEKGLQIAAPFLGASFGGPMGAAVGSGLASLLTGNKPQDALMSAAMGYGGGKMGLFGEQGQGLPAILGGKQFTPSSRQPSLFGSSPTDTSQTKPNVFSNIIKSAFKDRGDKPSYAMQVLAALGPGILSYMAAKKDAEKAYVPDASEYMSAVDTMYGGQTARPPEERRIQNLKVQVDPITGAATYMAGGGIMDVAETQEVSYPVTGFAGGGFPRKTGSITGPSTKTSDSIPARS